MYIIIFTDLDGTLLDEATYSFQAALPALAKIRELKIPLVLVSSKTRREMELYQQKLGLREPFICENGGGIFIPKGYFPFPIPEAQDREGYQLIRLGMDYQELRRRFGQIRMEFRNVLRGFGDMDLQEIVRRTGLSLTEAELARQREFGEPFVILSEDIEEIRNILNRIEKMGLRHTRGNRFYYLLGDNDKGKAARVLKELYEKAFGPVRTIALGDSLNDLPLLKEADYPVLIRKTTGYEAGIVLPKLIRSEKIGPEGWNETVLNLMERTEL